MERGSTQQVHQERGSLLDGISAIEEGKQESVDCGCGFTVNEMIRESCPGGCWSIGRASAT